MAWLEIDGVGIAHEVVGDGDRPVVITAGGRYSKDTPGPRELAGILAQSGCRVLIWDRPNCGASDMCFDAETETLLNANSLAGLLRALDFGPALMMGGSQGARLSLMTAINHPELVAGLFLLWVAGGPLGLAVLAMHYCHDSAFAAQTEGMEAVAALPCWQEQLTRNPANRARLLAQDPEVFVATMQRWAASYFPKDDLVVPAVSPDALRSIKVPTVVLNSGKSDFHHPRAITEALAGMIPGAQLQMPPWSDAEWNELLKTEGMTMYQNWDRLAPQILALARTVWA